MKKKEKKEKKTNSNPFFESGDFHDTIGELHLHMFMFICFGPFSLNKASARRSVGV